MFQTRCAFSRYSTCTTLHRGIPNDPQRTYAVISLSKRVLTQCDSQVSKLNRFAFALAEVAVRVAVFEPKFGVVLVALLHEACVLAVPKYYPFVQGRYASDEAGGAAVCPNSVDPHELERRSSFKDLKTRAS